MRPVVFVGCGGSGMSTVKFIHDLISVSLQDAGCGSKIPEAFQFLVVDVPANPQVVLPERIIYQPLAGSLTTWIGPTGIDTTLAKHQDAKRRNDYLQWRPDPAGLSPQFEEGAGQYRALGRAIATWNIEDFGKKFVTAAQRAISNADGLLPIAEKLGFEPKANLIGSPLVIVLSSLGGGAGSGVFLDICELIRIKCQGELASMQQNLISVLFDPSVFDHGNINLVDGGIPGNSLAAISELIASTAFTRPASPHFSSGSPNIGEFSGPQYTFLVGSPSGARGQGLTSPDSVYKTTARTVSAWVLNVEISKNFGAWVGNWVSNGVKGSAPQESSNGAPMRMPTSAFGYARLDLGRGRLQRFIIENLVREGIEQLVTKHLRTVSPDESSVDDLAISHYIDSNKYLVNNFLSTAGLNEHSKPENDEDNDDILNGLRNPNLSEELDRMTLDIVKDFTQYRSLQTLDSNINSEIVKAEISRIKTLHQLNVLSWSVEIQSKFAWAVVDGLAMHGVRVFETILSSAINAMNLEFPTQLNAEKDAGEIMGWKSNWDNRGRLDAFKNANKTITSPHLLKIREVVRQRLQWEIERDLRDIAIEVSKDVASNVLKPALRDIRKLRDNLEQTHDSSEFRNLSTLNAPSDSLLPTANETFLENPTDWKKTTERLLSESKTDVSRLALEILRSSYLDRETLMSKAEVENCKPWRNVQSWVPKMSVTLNQGAAQSIDLRFDFSFNEIMERAYGYFTWSKNRTAVIEYCKETINGYLNDQKVSQAVQDTRVTNFCEELRNTVEKSEPLVEVAWEKVRQKYRIDASDALTRIFSNIPLAKPNPNNLSSRVQGVLDEFNINDPGLFDLNSSNTFIEIFSACAPMPPANFFSLSSSIVTARNAAIRSTITQDSFFRARRTRPFDEFLPYSKAVRMSFARGWIIGMLTGSIEPGFTTKTDIFGVESKILDIEVAITVKSERGASKLLHHPVGQYTESESKQYREIALMTSALSSGMLAEMMSVVSASSSEIEAFQEVIRLGYGNSQYATESYDLNDQSESSLEKWIIEKATFDRDKTIQLIRETAHKLNENAEGLLVARDQWLQNQAVDNVFQAYPYEFQVADLYNVAAKQVSRYLMSLLNG